MFYKIYWRIYFFLMGRVAIKHDGLYKKMQEKYHGPVDPFVDDEFFGWLCWCGHWEESWFHCANCINEPPWGCDCGCQWEHDEYDEWDEFFIEEMYRDALAEGDE